MTGAGQQTLYFDFTNRNNPYALFTEGGGGQFMGNVANYSSSGAGPIAGTNANTDYALAGGAICLTTDTNNPFNAINVPISCTSPFAHGAAINNNLGANQAAYAIDVPELNAFLASWSGASAYTNIHVDLRFGCDPATIGTSGGTVGVGSCVGRDANNGFEQLFIGTANTVTQVPEPGILGLLALGMLGLAAATRRRKI